MQLPDELRFGLDAELAKTSSRHVAGAVRGLSERYRVHHGRSSAPFLHSDLDVVAYAAYRLPATYAAIRAVLEEVRERRPGLQPASMLDVGAGPGTAAWAALDVWPEIERIALLERDPRMIQIGKALAAHARGPALREAIWRQVDATAPWDIEPADLPVAAYMLGELPAESRVDVVRRLWEHTAGTCAIVEPGTPRGFGLIEEAGDELAKLGAHIVAPFPVDWECLEHKDDWCHFSVRVPRTRTHRSAKESTLSYEDEKYSYVVASRTPGAPIAARVIRHPQARSGHIRLVLCTAEGVNHIVVTRSDREAYRRAKDLVWGSAIPAEEAGLFGLPS